MQGGGLAAWERVQSSILEVVGSSPPVDLFQKGPTGSGQGAFVSIATAPLGAGNLPGLHQGGELQSPRTQRAYVVHKPGFHAAQSKTMWSDRFGSYI